MWRGCVCIERKGGVTKGRIKKLWIIEKGRRRISFLCDKRAVDVHVFSDNVMLCLTEQNLNLGKCKRLSLGVLCPLQRAEWCRLKVNAIGRKKISEGLFLWWHHPFAQNAYICFIFAHTEHRKLHCLALSIPHFIIQCRSELSLLTCLV